MSSMSGSGFQFPFAPPPAYGCPLRDVPIWGFHGEQDQISQYRPVLFSVTQWENSCGALIEWTNYPDAGHFETYDRAYRDPALYEWMLSHQKGE